VNSSACVCALLISDYNVYISDGAEGPNGEALSLASLLVFVTGADEVPALGFKPDPCIAFLHQGDVPVHLLGLPQVSTCSLQLQLPVVADFETFKVNMLSAIAMVSTFTTA
jgi:hypothetical protein